MEPPYDVSFSIALGSFSGSAVVVEAYGTVSGYPGRLRVPVVFPAGATNGVAGVCGESGASPAWSTRSFYEFYRQDAGWDFLYTFEVDHAGAGAAILDVADGLRCVAQGADSALYRLERPLVFLPAPVESTATAPGAASLRGPGILFVDPADVPVTGTYAPEGVMGEKQPMRRTLAKTTLRAESSANGESPGESSDTLFPVNLRLSDAGDALPDADERWRGVVVPVGNSVHFIIEDPFGMEEVPDDAVLTLSKTSDAANAFPAFQTVSWTAGEVPENWLVSSSGPGVAVFELSLDGTDVHSKDRVRISVVGIDLDIDSDNDGDIDSEDDGMEDSAELPGKALFLNELDTDKDGLPDFADGFNCQFHNTIQSADAASKQFAVMTVNVGSPSQGGKLVLKCDVADGQAGLNRSGSGTWNQPYTFSSSASSKKIRIWTKDGNQKRSRDPFPDGDLIVPGQTYDIQQIAPWGTTNFYIEAIHGSDSIGDVRISAELRSDETDEMVESDAVRATVFHIEAVHPIPEDFGSNAGKIMIYPSALSDTS